MAQQCHCCLCLMKVWNLSQSKENLRQISCCGICSWVCICLSWSRVCRADGLNEQTWISFAPNRNMAVLEPKSVTILIWKLFCASSKIKLHFQLTDSSNFSPIKWVFLSTLQILLLVGSKEHLLVCTLTRHRQCFCLIWWSEKKLNCKNKNCLWSRIISRSR